MNGRRFIVGLAILALLLITAGQLQAAIVGVAGGTGAPAGTLGSYTMTPFADDIRATNFDVTTVASPLGGDVGFSVAVSHREIGSGWVSWSHGYTGDVYYSNGATSVTLTLPAQTGAFYFYAEPNPFAVHTITATSAGESISQDVDGSGGASYYGFYTTDALDPILSITVSSAVDFAVGEFGISKTAAVPEPGTFAIWGTLGGLGLIVARRRRRTS